jgi:hypothetical protein
MKISRRTSPTLQFGWLDLGEEGRRRAIDYLSQFKADNTLAELGFGILRDAFADIFYPATNTIMTRTRYADDIKVVREAHMRVFSEKADGSG